jgi:hypothetical protein
MRCDPFRVDLAAHVYGDLSAEETRALEAHLEGCAGCREELRGLQRAAGALGEDVMFPGEAGMDWDAFAASTVQRITGLRGRAAGKAAGLAAWWHQVLRAPGWAAAAAAMLLVAGVAIGTYGALMITGGAAGDTPQVPMARTSRPALQQVLLPEAMLVDIQNNTARAGTRRYLAESRALLTSLVASPVHCGQENVDISAERAKSLQLIRRQRLIADQLESLPLARAQEVCRDLEQLFLEILSLSDCARAEQILELRRLVESRQLLLRLELLNDEMARSQSLDV